VTGAGDTVIAVLSVLLACGVSLRDALPVVNRAVASWSKIRCRQPRLRELFP
jgi:bifunctional ADP-heptose synthase (sugar kinase/adenylyltransferase)